MNDSENNSAPANTGMSQLAQYRMSQRLKYQQTAELQQDNNQTQRQEPVKAPVQDQQMDYEYAQNPSERSNSMPQVDSHQTNINSSQAYQQPTTTEMQQYNRDDGQGQSKSEYQKMIEAQAALFPDGFDDDSIDKIDFDATGAMAQNINQNSNYANNTNQRDYQNDYGDQDDLDGVRQADSQSMDQLIGGGGDEERLLEDQNMQALQEALFVREQQLALQHYEQQQIRRQSSASRQSVSDIESQGDQGQDSSIGRRLSRRQRQRMESDPRYYQQLQAQAAQIQNEAPPQTVKCLCFGQVLKRHLYVHLISIILITVFILTCLFI